LIKRFRPARSKPAAQRGVAIISALLVVALSAILVSGMLWREQVQIRRIENQRLLAQALRGPVGAPLVDRTGLQGFFDIDIHYTPDRTISGNDTVIPEYPTLITAIQEQLGLKLEQHREPQQVLVVDHIEMPTPD